MSGGSNLGAGNQTRRAEARDAALGATDILASTVGDAAAHAARAGGLGTPGAIIVGAPLHGAAVLARTAAAALRARDEGDPHYLQTGATTVAADVATRAMLEAAPAAAGRVAQTMLPRRGAAALGRAASGVVGGFEVAADLAELVAPATERTAERMGRGLNVLPVGSDVHDAQAEAVGIAHLPWAIAEARKRAHEAVQAGAGHVATWGVAHDELEERMAGLPDLRPVPAAAPALSLRRSADTSIAPPATRRRIDVPRPPAPLPAAAPGIGGSMRMSGFVDDHGRLGVSASASGGGGSSLTADLTQGGMVGLVGSAPVTAPAGFVAVAAPLAGAAAGAAAVLAGAEVIRAITLNQQHRHQPHVPLSDAEAAARLDAAHPGLGADAEARRLEQERERLEGRHANDRRRVTRVSEREATPAGQAFSGLVRSIGRVFGGVDATRPRDAERMAAETQAELARVEAQLAARAAARPFQASGGGAGVGGSTHSTNERRG